MLQQNWSLQKNDLPSLYIMRNKNNKKFVTMSPQQRKRILDGSGLKPSPAVQKILAEFEKNKIGPFTRALERKSKLREITTALTERVANIAKKAAALPKELLKNIKLR